MSRRSVKQHAKTIQTRSRLRGLKENTLESIADAIDQLRADRETSGKQESDKDVDADMIEAFVTPEGNTQTQDLSVSNLRDKEQPERPTKVRRKLDMDDQPPMMMAARSSAMEDGGGQGHKEPLVKYNVRADATLFTNVRTAYIRGTYYFSFNGLDQATPVVLKFRLNNPRNIFANSTLTRQDLNSGQSILRAKGLSNDMAHQNSGYQTITAISNAKLTNVNNGALAPFPNTVIGDTAADTTNVSNRFSSSGTISDANTRPAWRDWYETIWQAMHVMETDYKMTFFSGHSITNSDLSNNDSCFTTATVFTTTDTETASTGGFQTTPTDARLRDMLQFPYIQQHNIALRDPSNPTNQFNIIQGTWKDSDTSAGGTTLDEQQIKTWYPCGSGVDYNPAWRVDKTVLAYAGEFSSNHRPCINLKLELQYKVQYRDVRREWLYPQSNAATLNTNLTNKVTRQQLTQEIISFITGFP